MAAKLTNANLLQISKSNATTITNFRLGVHLSSTSGRSIDELTEAACRDRLAFARRTLSYARTTMRGAKPQYRVALARSYYAMYHAARAVVYFIKRGDDHEAHSELPKRLD